MILDCLYPLFLWIKAWKTWETKDNIIGYKPCLSRKHLTKRLLADYAGRTTSKSGLRTRQTCGFFYACIRRIAFYGQVERPIYQNKARRLLPVVETCPPSLARATTKAKGGNMNAEPIGAYTGHHPFFSSHPKQDRDFLLSVNPGYPSMQALEQVSALLDELKTHILRYGAVHAETPNGDFFPIGSLVMLTETVTAIIDAVINGQNKPKEPLPEGKEASHA